jgi:hypothetical protein
MTALRYLIGGLIFAAAFFALPFLVYIIGAGLGLAP